MATQLLALLASPLTEENKIPGKPTQAQGKKNNGWSGMAGTGSWVLLVLICKYLDKLIGGGLNLWELNQLIKKLGSTVIWIIVPWRGPCATIEFHVGKKTRGYCQCSVLLVPVLLSIPNWAKPTYGPFFGERENFTKPQKTLGKFNYFWHC